MKKIKFAVFKDNKILFWTESRECIPDEKRLDEIAKGGYKFTVDGKAVSLKKLKELLNEKG